MQIYISVSGKRSGPFTLDMLNIKLKCGTLKKDDFAWYQGLPDWIPVNNVPNIELPCDSAACQSSNLASFSFEALDAKGQKVKSCIEATNKEEAFNLLRSKGFFPTSVIERKKVINIIGLILENVILVVVVLVIAIISVLAIWGLSTFNNRVQHQIIRSLDKAEQQENAAHGN